MATAEAAAYLGISVSALRRWCDKGVIPHWRTPGGQRRFDQDQLQTWLANRQEAHDGWDGGTRST